MTSRDFRTGKSWSRAICDRSHATAAFWVVATMLAGTAAGRAQISKQAALALGGASSGTPSVGSSLGASALALSGASSSASTSLMEVPEDFSKLKISPGFLLSVQVFDEPDLSNSLRVGQDGNLVLPLAGPVHVAGDTVAEAEAAMQDKLKAAEVLKNPQVTLNIIQYEPTMITVLGEVNTPGRLRMLVPHSLLDVVSFAGGETDLAGGVIIVRHTGEDGKVEEATYHYGRTSDGESISQVIVHDGDTVNVPRAGIVYVLGAVNRPGGYLMQEDGKLDAAQALSMALGTSLLAKTGSIHIIRRQADGTFVEFPLNYQKMVNGKITPPVLQAQDIVYVPVSKTKTALASGTGIIGSTAGATIYATHP
jgi:polysaccharide biosynthesis/export protein